LKNQIQEQEDNLEELRKEHEDLNLKKKETKDKKEAGKLDTVLDAQAIEIAKAERDLKRMKDQLSKVEADARSRIPKSLIDPSIQDLCDDFDIQSTFSGIELSTSDFEEITESDFDGFGMMTSKEYKKRLDDLTTGMLSTEKMMIMVLCVAVKNKNRIMNSLDKFKAKAWYNPVKAFFDKKTVQYTSEVTGPNIMPVVNIPTCNPPLAVIAWLLIHDKWSVRAFMSNLWSGQLGLSVELQKEHRKWEEYFWEVSVRKSRSAAYERGFHDDYYETKETDRYPLMDLETKLWFNKDKCKTAGSGYNKTDIQAYLVKTAELINKSVGRPMKVVTDNSGEPLISDTMYNKVSEVREKRKKEEEDKKKETKK
jgi:hypothetical protein